MKFGKLKSILPLAARKSITLVNGTSNNKGYYFLNNINSNILWYNRTFNAYRILLNNIWYCSICYDSNENCLWSINKNCDKLYKLDLSMRQISCVPINNICPYLGSIRDISYNKHNDNLILTTDNKIFEINKGGNLTCIFHDFKSNYYYLSSYYLYCNMISLWCYKNCYYISIINSNKDINYYKLPIHFKFKSIIFANYISSHNTCLIYLLANCKKNHDHLLCISLNNCYINSNSHYKNNNHSSSLDDEFVSKYNNDVTSKFINQHDNDYDSNKQNNYDNFNCHHHKHDYNLKQSKCVILESIALQEVGLSNIINLEGEKLQKAISLAKNTNDLLNVNSSVDKLLTNITILENILYSKLKSILDKD